MMKTLVKERFYLIPSIYQVVHDEPAPSLQDPVELSKHFDDVYKLYLRRLSDFEMTNQIDHTRENELTSLLSELIRVKRQLNEG